MAITFFTFRKSPETLGKHKLWFSRVNDYEALLKDPQIEHNGSFIDIDSVSGSPLRLLAHPAKYDGVRPKVHSPPQPLGAQSAAILSEIGYSSEEVRDLSERRIIHVWDPAESE